MKIVISIFFVLISCLAVSAQANPVCPKITVEGPAGITIPGDIMSFKARTDGGLPPDSKFEWTVSAGTIESGQGTQSIAVRVPNDFDRGNITAIAKINGLPKNCLSSSSETVGVPLPNYEPPDRWYGDMALNDEKARLLSAAFLTQKNPGMKLFIVKYLPSFGETERKRQSQLTSFLIHVIKFPHSRFAFVNKAYSTKETVIVITIPGFKFDGMLLQ